MKTVLAMVFTTAFLVGQYQTGMTRQCVYDFAGTQYTITVQGYQLCPMSINI